MINKNMVDRIIEELFLLDPTMLYMPKNSYFFVFPYVTMRNNEILNTLLSNEMRLFDFWQTRHALVARSLFGTIAHRIDEG